MGAMLRGRVWTALASVLIVMVFAACAPEPPPDRSGLQVITPAPTLDLNDPVALCQIVIDAWEADWPRTIDALEMLLALDAGCGDDVLLEDRLYAAYLAYGALLEERGRPARAADAYRAALAYNAAGEDAIEALHLLETEIANLPPTCSADVVSQALAALPDYEPSESGEFVRVGGGMLSLGDEPLIVYGVNYYPRDYPDTRFLQQMNVDSVEFELELMRASGLNTLRIFLRHEDLFQCPGNGVVPVVENVARLDGFVRMAAAHDFRLIMVLNHEPDLIEFPLYDLPLHTREQMRFIFERYSDEPAVMAYDLRDRGDEDISVLADLTQETALLWLVEVVALLREAAPEQLVTVGWVDDSQVTAPLVDFVSFQHEGDVESLRQRIAVLRDATAKPVLLAFIGYNTFELDELGQRQAFQRAFEAVERNALAGWTVWTAFDFPRSVTCIEPDCPGEDGPVNHYGLWTTSYFPKRAIDAVEMATGVDSGDDS